MDKTDAIQRLLKEKCPLFWRDIQNEPQLQMFFNFLRKSDKHSEMFFARLDAGITSTEVTKNVEEYLELVEDTKSLWLPISDFISDDTKIYILEKRKEAEDKLKGLEAGLWDVWLCNLFQDYIKKIRSRKKRREPNDYSDFHFSFCGSVL